MTEQAKDNLALWNAVSRTDPAHTKTVTDRGRRYTDIDPMYLIQRATELWGPYGSTWGLRRIERAFFPFQGDPLLADSKQRYCILSAEFFYPGGQFEIGNEMPLFSAKQHLYDNDWLKKLETNTLSKALSKVGFGADVFLGKFDDARYVQMVNEEYRKQESGRSERPTMPAHVVLIGAAWKGAMQRGVKSPVLYELLGTFGATNLREVPEDQADAVIKALSEVSP